MNIFNDGLLLRNPLRIMNHGNKIISNDSLGAIVARAGVGKTALIVQLAINTIFQHKKVLHVSLNDPVDKVITWYRELLNNLVNEHNLGPIDILWESIQSNQFIMTFTVESFSIPTLEEKLNDLTKQQIFQPDVIIIDGLPFNNSELKTLKNLKEFSRQKHLHMWLTITTHRHEKPTEKGFPIQLNNSYQIFDDIIQLTPKNKKVYIESLKGKSNSEEDIQYFLNPSTMLVQNYKL